VRPDAGSIALDGTDLAPQPPHQRPVNTMFQSYALFPHLDVAANVGFGLRRQGMQRAAIAARVTEMLTLVSLQGFEARKPQQLSGGQQQRVALARSLAPNPRLLLLDEPLSALDRNLRIETRAELARLQRQLATTFIVVTHDQEEALILATRIGVMQHGRLAQVGTQRRGGRKVNRAALQHDTVVFARRLAAHHAALHVAQHSLRFTLEGIAVAAATRGEDCDGVVRAQLDHVYTAKLPFIPSSAIEDGLRSGTGQPAGQAPRLKPDAIHPAPQHLRAGATWCEGQFQTHAAAPASWATGVRPQRVVQHCDCC